MCIAIYKPADVIINKETLAQCFKANPDGAGFMFTENKELHMQKGFFTFDEFWNAYEPHKEKQAAIHFRIKTHGKIDTNNCHPFMINKGLGFIHNGVITGFGEGDKSDTNHFNDEIIKPLVHKYGNAILTNPSIKFLIESKIGYSKFVILDRHGNYSLFNESKGLWDGEVWFSNTSYKPTPIQPALPFKQPMSYYNAPKPKSKSVEVGDVVELMTGIYDPATKHYFKPKEIFEVIAINKDYTADLMHEYDDAFLYNVSYAKFDFYESQTELQDTWEPVQTWESYIGV